MTNKINHYLNKLKAEAHYFQRPLLIIGIMVMSIVLALQVGILSPLLNFQNKNPSKSVESAEIKGIKTTKNLTEQVKLYKKLIEREGPAKAQEDLYKSGLPFDGETHLLNHTVGDYLYEKYGPAGLSQCKEYFLASCYHGFILHAIASGGMPEVAKTFTYCQAGGLTVLVQCAHAIGHGFLANFGYQNLIKALKTCDEAGGTIPGFIAYNCHDGVFMENVWGVHDGEPSPDRWVNPKDIFYPCNDKRIDDKYVLACWSNQPSLVYQFFKGNVKKVADDLCNKVEDPKYQQMCFDGLARQINPIVAGDSNKTLQMCGLMPDTKWRNANI